MGATHSNFRESAPYILPRGVFPPPPQSPDYTRSVISPTKKCGSHNLKKKPLEGPRDIKKGKKNYRGPNPKLGPKGEISRKPRKRGPRESKNPKGPTLEKFGNPKPSFPQKKEFSLPTKEGNILALQAPLSKSTKAPLLKPTNKRA